MRVRASGMVLALALMAAPALAQEEPKQVDKSGEWSVFVFGSGANKTCFVVSQPRDMKPTGVRRGPVYFYVSSWTQDNVSNEVSIKLGYPVRETVPVEIAIGGDKFTLYGKEEGAYVEGKDNEQNLVDAMRKGNVMVVQARSARGTLTTDEYSLAGVTAALDRSTKECS